MEYYSTFNQPFVSMSRYILNISRHPFTTYSLCLFAYSKCLSHTPMAPQLFSSSPPPLFSRHPSLSLIITSSSPTVCGFSFSDDSVFFPNRGRTFSCSSIRNITYPFTGGDRPDYCGLPDFKLRCMDNHTEFTHHSLTNRVLSTNQSSRTMTIARLDLWNNIALLNSPILLSTLRPTITKTKNSP
uniref:Wall-associated receptor kinase galacturonan-binding domain-containing protein n=1 Tax=Nicotiana tabacum TaxID=4097 RepID=A0A1S4CRV2_TOBAC|nr:PREDICTED: uncharacterized protein LOC107821804 [Nicotiana tabacum]